MGWSGGTRAWGAVTPCIGYGVGITPILDRKVD
jgi:hypothetical protein